MTDHNEFVTYRNKVSVLLGNTYGIDTDDCLDGVSLETAFEHETPRELVQSIGEKYNLIELNTIKLDSL